MVTGLTLGLFVLGAVCFALLYKTIDFFENV